MELSKKVSLLIGSCDKYSFTWNNFFKLLDVYWGVDCKKYLVSDTIESDRDDVVNCLSNNAPWADSIIQALKKIETDYVVFLLDDYFLAKPISEAFMSGFISFMDCSGANKIQLGIPEPIKFTYSGFEISGHKMHKIDDSSEYLTSVQPSIWRKDYLLSMLKPGENPWQHELIGNSRVLNKDNKFWMTYIHEPIYFNAYNKGRKCSTFRGISWDSMRNKHALEEMKDQV